MRYETQIFKYFLTYIFELNRDLRLRRTVPGFSSAEHYFKEIF